MMEGRASLSAYAKGYADDVAEVRANLARMASDVRAPQLTAADRLLLRAAELIYELSVAITLGSVEFVEPAPDPQAALFPED